MMARSTTRSNQRPDTLMQDRLPPARQNPLATHGRTIHVGHFRKGTLAIARSALPSHADIVSPPLRVRELPQAEVKRHAITCTTLSDIVQSLLDEVSDY